MWIIGDRYNIITEIKYNGMEDSESKLYVAKDLKGNNATVAVKILEIDLSVDYDIKRELFRREYVSLSRLNHENIVKYIDSGQDGEYLYLVMEYCDSNTLNKYLDENDIAIEEKLKIAINIAYALAYAHEKGVIHRDLKPSNIMVNSSNDIKIIDFGISKIIGSKYNSDSTVKCFMTIKYAAPEQLMKFEAKKESDIYSYGLNLAYILSGIEPPESKCDVNEYIRSIKCSSTLKEILNKLVNSDIEKRIKSMYGVIRELENELNSIRAKTKRLYINFNSYIQRELVNLGVLDYQYREHTNNFLRKDLSASSIYRNSKKSEFYLIGKTIKYTCRLLKNNRGLKIIRVNCLDDQLEWEKESEKGVRVRIPWIPIQDENDCGEESYMSSLLQEIVDNENIIKAKRDKCNIKSSLLEKWNRYLQEEFTEIDSKKKLCKYRKFELDETGYRLRVEVDDLNVDIKKGEAIQMTDEEDKQITVGEFDDIYEKGIIIRLNSDINPSDICSMGIMGIDVVREKSNFKKLARALNLIKYSDTANRNLSSIIAEPSLITVNNPMLLRKEQYFQDVLKSSPNSANAKAVKKALGVKDLFLIQGPPGTGKSTVITEIVCQILRENPEQKILLASQSHVAVDHVVNKVARLLPDKRIIRIGRSEKISEQSQNLIMSEQMNRWVDSVKEKSTNGLEDYIQKNFDYDITKIKDELKLKEEKTLVNYEEGGEEAKVRKLISLTREWHRRLGRLDEFDEIFANKASIIAATCLGIASRNVLNDIDFDWIIVDEAARATPLELLVPLVRGKKIILVGDHRQLPPVVNTQLSKLKLEEKGIRQMDLEISLFEELYEKMSDEAKVILNTQYRMHPDISKLVADVFYPSINIETSITPDDRFHMLDFWPKSIKWIDTSECSDSYEVDEVLSKKNPIEAKIILNELEHIEKLYQEKGVKDATVAVISGYDAHKNLLNNLIKPNDKYKWRNLKIIIDNVDAFQGSETDIVIYSLVRCNKENKIGFLYDERRLNVALSRGKSCLIIVGNKKFAEKARSFRGNPFVDVIKFISCNKSSCMVEVYNEI